MAAGDVQKNNVLRANGDIFWNSKELPRESLGEQAVSLKCCMAMTRLS